MLRGGSDWWLRTPAKDSSEVQYVDTGGWVLANDAHGAGERDGVRPALYLNLSNTGQYSYAGIVCSDGTVDGNGTKKITVKSVTLSGISRKIAAGGKTVTITAAAKDGSGKKASWKIQVAKAL